MARASKEAAAALRFLPKLVVPEGRLAGRKVKLATYQKDFVRGAFAKGIEAACLSIGRGNAKTALSAGLALGHLTGEIAPQPKREILFAARNRDQAKTAFGFWSVSFKACQKMSKSNSRSGAGPSWKSRQRKTAAVSPVLSRLTASPFLAVLPLWRFWMNGLHGNGKKGMRWKTPSSLALANATGARSLSAPRPRMMRTPFRGGWMNRPLAPMSRSIGPSPVYRPTIWKACWWQIRARWKA